MSGSLSWYKTDGGDASYGWESFVALEAGYKKLKDIKTKTRKITVNPVNNDDDNDGDYDDNDDRW